MKTESQFHCIDEPQIVPANYQTDGTETIVHNVRTQPSEICLIAINKYVCFMRDSTTVSDSVRLSVCHCATLCVSVRLCAGFLPK